MVIFVLTVGLLLLVQLVFTALMCFNLRKAKPPDLSRPEAVRGTRWEPCASTLSRGIDSIRNQPWEDVWLDSEDGVKLHARLLPGNSGKTVLLAHGYRSSGENDFCGIFDYYHSRGFTILMIDQRAHGESEGRMIGFGVREYEDVALWIHYATVNLPGSIWLHGVSMGAVSCLLAVSRGYPDRLRGIIADSAYDRIDELLFYQSMRKYRLPRRLIIPLLAVSGRLLLGGGFNKLSPSKAAAECALPLLMIHGDNDHTIPPDMPARYRAVCGDRTTFVTIPGARHAMCWLKNPQAYEAALDVFYKETQCK